jgi:hypothetical protein
MGYSKSYRAFQRVQIFLDAILESKNDSKITWKPLNTSTNDFAYKLRNGMRYAKENPRECAKYKDLDDNFVIKIKGSVVIAERKLPLLEAEEVNEVVVMRFDNVDNLLAIIGAAIANKGIDELHFPGVKFTSLPLSNLYSWTSVNDYKIYKDLESDGLILSKISKPELEEWKPESSM